MRSSNLAILLIRLCSCAAVALVVATFAACAKKDASPQASAQPVLPVTITKARRGEIAERLTLVGSVAAKAQANLQSMIAGQVLGVYANVGDRVSAGQILVRIDDSTLRAQLQQNQGNLAAARARLAQTSSGAVGTSTSATANLASAQVAYQTALANVRRNKQLLAQGYVSQLAVDEAQQAAAAAQAQLRSAEVAARNTNLGGSTTSAAQSEIQSLQAAVTEAAGTVQLTEVQIGQTVITAPFDGILTQRGVDPGTLASPGTPLVQVSELDPVYVNVGIPEENLPYIHSGTQADITVDTLPGHVWHGSVSAVNSATSQGTLSYLARVVLPNERNLLKAGMVANASFVKAQHRDVVLVPRAALFQGESGDAVYVLAKSPECKCDGTAKVVRVHRGLQTETEAEVSGAGIAPGTQIIVQRPDQLKDGSPVSVSSVGSQAPASSQT